MQQRTFENIKKAISKTPVITYDDLEQSVTIHTDMSDVGVGAVLLQNEKPVSYTSMVWNDYEKKQTAHQFKMRCELLCLDYKSSAIIAMEDM